MPTRTRVNQHPTGQLAPSHPDQLAPWPTREASQAGPCPWRQCCWPVLVSMSNSGLAEGPTDNLHDLEMWCRAIIYLCEKVGGPSPCSLPLVAAVTELFTPSSTGAGRSQMLSSQPAPIPTRTRVNPHPTGQLGPSHPDQLAPWPTREASQAGPCPWRQCYWPVLVSISNSGLAEGPTDNLHDLEMM